MSHQPERKEKDCLNCGTIVTGRFCQNCGQENVVTSESFWSLAKHFVFDILHFDGAFFHTLKYLLIRPGFVAAQYVKGKRKEFLHPIRMYLFTSAIFFLIFFSFDVPGIHIGSADSVMEDTISREGRATRIERYTKRLGNPATDSLYKARIALLRDTTRPVRFADLGIDSNSHFMSFGDHNYKNRHEYDSIQASLPEAERDGWIKRRLNYKGLEIDEKYKGKTAETSDRFVEILMHRLPYMLFISLPFFALILKLLYWRRKEFYYSDHAVFTLYHYIFVFLALLLVFLVGYINSTTGWNWLNYLSNAIQLFILVFLYVSMKKFYRQGWIKTFFKFLLLCLLGLGVLIFLFAFFLFFSIFQL